MKILDLGCGKRKRPGSIGVDYSDRHNADVIHNLNVFPYPFFDQEIDQIYMDNVLEHLDDPLKVMEEIYRICKPGARIEISVPYFRSLWAFIDPTHKNYFTVDSFAYYDPTHIICRRYDYTPARFLVEGIHFNRFLKNRLFKRLVIIFANKHPNRYEYYFSHLYPLDEISYSLQRC